MTMQSTAQGKGLFNREQMLKLGFRFDENAPPAPPPKPVEFTPEQQVRLNAIVADERRRAEDATRQKTEKDLFEKYGIKSFDCASCQ